jgi:hypothetical protein
MAGRRTFVDGVVDGATEVPHRHDGAALFGREHEERIVEAGLARHYDRRPSHRMSTGTTTRQPEHPDPRFTFVLTCGRAEDLTR